MLIRSQDRECLYNLNTISGLTYQETHDYNRGKEVNTNHEICIDYGGLADSIGVYSTKEKAIKVLDMIQDAYTQYGTIKEGLGNVHGAFNFPKCFQTPQDSEVQI